MANTAVVIPALSPPRRYGAQIKAQDSGRVFEAQKGNMSPVGVRLTQNELKEPLGRSTIRGTGAVRFGVMPELSVSSGSRPAGKFTPRGESAAQVIGAQFSLHMKDEHASVTGSTTTTSNNNSPNVSARSMGGGGSSLSPRSARSTATTFSALPGGSDAAATFRFGEVHKSCETAKSIITPGEPDTHVAPSPGRVRSQRFFNTQRAEPSALPAACLPTKEGMAVKAALPSIKARDTISAIIANAATYQPDNLASTSGKITARGDPSPAMSSSRGDRSFGMSNIRTELSPPSTRKLTDARNYGDEPSTRDLVNGGDATSVKQMLNAKTLTSPEDAVHWSQRCMWGLSPQQAREAWKRAAGGRSSPNNGDGAVSLRELKIAVDELY